MNDINTKDRIKLRTFQLCKVQTKPFVAILVESIPSPCRSHEGQVAFHQYWYCTNPSSHLGREWREENQINSTNPRTKMMWLTLHSPAGVGISILLVVSYNKKKNNKQPLAHGNNQGQANLLTIAARYLVKAPSLAASVLPSIGILSNGLMKFMEEKGKEKAAKDQHQVISALKDAKLWNCTKQRTLYDLIHQSQS